MPQKHTLHSCATLSMYPELYKCNSWESTFVEFCVDGINLYVENIFIDSLKPRINKIKESLKGLHRVCQFFLYFGDSKWRCLNKIYETQYCQFCQKKFMIQHDPVNIPKSLLSE
jgi:hypothetical protein